MVPFLVSYERQFFGITEAIPALDKGKGPAPVEPSVTIEYEEIPLERRRPPVPAKDEPTSAQNVESESLEDFLKELEQMDSTSSVPNPAAGEQTMRIDSAEHLVDDIDALLGSEEEKK